MEAAFCGAPLVVSEIDEGAESDVDESINDCADRFFSLGGGGERMALEEFVAQLKSRDQSRQQRRVPEGNQEFDVLLILVRDAVQNPKTPLDTGQSESREMREGEGGVER